MTYEAREESDRAGDVIEFVRFAMDADNKWLYTSSDDVVSYGGEDYLPISLNRSEPSMSQQIEDTSIRLQMPLDVPVIERFKTNAPHKQIYVAYFRRHRGDAEVIPYYQGRLAGVRYTGEGAEVVVQSIESMMERTGARPQWQNTCRFYLYDGEVTAGHGCPVPRAPYKRTGTVISQSADQVTAAILATEANGWFTFGYAERADGVKSMILGHTGDTVTLLAPFDASVLNESVDFYAGCDRAWPTCKSAKFAAYTRDGRDFGGTPRVPVKNPYEKGVR